MRQGLKLTKSEQQAVNGVVEWLLDPVQFVRDVFGAEPDEWQADVLRDVAENPRVGMSACKGPGKSCVLAWIIWWFLFCHVDAQVMVLSITKDNLKDNLWKELAKWMGRSVAIKRKFEYTAQRIKSKERGDTWWASARGFSQSADEEEQATALAGFHAHHIMVVLDEMGDFPHGVVAAAEAIFAVVGCDPHLVAAWNPTSTSGPAYRACTTDSKLWKITPITGDPDDPKRSPRISKEWAIETINRWGRDNPWVQVNVFGRFPDKSSDKLLSANDVTAAQSNDAPAAEYRTDARIWGLDPARFGKDEAALCRRQGKVCFRFHGWRGLDGPELASRVAAMLLEAEKVGEDPDAIFVDVGSVGASAFDHLNLLGWGTKIIPVDFGSKASDSRFADKRSEIWWEMADWVKKQKACLPTDTILAAELPEPKYFFKVRNRQTVFALETKEQMASRGVDSPNRADALALTFSAPVMPRSLQIEAELVHSGHRCKTEYDKYNRDKHRPVTTRDPLHVR
jgi:hypothetical protein